MSETAVAGGGSYKWLVLLNVMLTTFMAVLDSTVVNTGLPVIMGTLGASHGVYALHGNDTSGGGVVV